VILLTGNHTYFKKPPANQVRQLKAARGRALASYKRKRANRGKFLAKTAEEKRIRYDSRKIIADNRPRYKGRFVKTEEIVRAPGTRSWSDSAKTAAGEPDGRTAI